MRVIAAPAFNPYDVLERCLASVADADVKARIQAEKQNIEGIIATFHAAAQVKEFYKVPHCREIGRASNQDLKALYQKGMIHRSGQAKDIYVSLRKLAEFSICPLCGQNQVSGLDHYLPQSRYGGLVVCPENLVPACADCNRFKLARAVSSAEHQTIHPYFDDYTTEKWLFAELANPEVAVLSFLVIAPGHWNDVDKMRVAEHFKTFKLGSLYGSNSANELVCIKLALREIMEEGGEAAVRAELARRSRTHSAAYRNSWQSAMYSCLSCSDWYVNGGFDTA